MKPKTSKFGKGLDADVLSRRLLHMDDLKIYATHLFVPTELSSGYDGPSMGQCGMLESQYTAYAFLGHTVP